MKLKEYRVANGLTQEQIAKILNIPKKTYQNYEREVREADSDVLCSLADYYGISLDDLVGRKQNIYFGERLSEDEQILINYFRELTPSGKELVVNITKDILDEFKRLQESK